MNRPVRSAAAIGLLILIAVSSAELLPGVITLASRSTALASGDPLLRSTGTLTEIGAMQTARAAHTATVLPDGRVLLAGGIERDGVVLQSAELYDPAANRFSATSEMTEKRVDHSATLLADGTVLVAGGYGNRALSSAEIYDPVTNTFTPTGSMSVPRDGFTATLLLDGRVLVAGGATRSGPYASAEIYDPATGTFTAAGEMTTPRTLHTATLLPDGRVLITGGDNERDEVMASTELYDPATGTFTPTGSLSVPRHKHAAILLADGMVLILGGSDHRDWRGQYQSAEVYDPATGQVNSTRGMKATRFKLAASVVSLGGSEVLVAGGSRDVELYDSAAGRFNTVEGEIDSPRYFMAATLLPDGRVLITGGYDDAIEATARAWIYTPKF